MGFNPLRLGAGTPIHLPLNRPAAGEDCLENPLIHKPNFFVFTGGPGVGKTTLIRHLQAAGERVVEESARAVIREQVERGGPAVPWLDNQAFADRTGERDTAIFDALTQETGRIFFDRGIFDSYGANGAIPSPTLIEAISTRRYNRQVFVFPPWREIYQTDAERKQDWAEAEGTFGKMLSVLPALGYEAIVVPKADVATRAAFVLSISSPPTRSARREAG